MELTTIKENHVTYQYIHTLQFKSKVIRIRFFEDYDETLSLARYLMLQMLKSKSKNYPSRKAINQALDGLYDAVFSVQSSKFGTYHVNTLSLMVIDDKYTLNDALFDDSLVFLKSIMLHPLFDEATLEEEKSFLLDMIKADYANKTRFASKEYARYLMADHPYKGEPYGDISMIDQIGLDDIKKAYHRMFNENHIVFSVTGALDQTKTHAHIKKLLPLKGIPLNNAIIYRHPFEVKDNYFNEAPVSQNRFFVALKTPIYYRDNDYLSMVVLVSLLGEGSDSLLFKTIRETHSLAYYVYANYSPFSGIITLASGLDHANVKKAYTYMQTIIKSLKDGTFSEDDLTLTKTNLISAYKQGFDSITALSMKALRHTLFEVPFDETTFIEGIKQVDKSAIIKCAQTLELLFTYEYGVKA